MNRDLNIDDFRQIFESDKQWLARKQFITKHIANYDTSDRDHGVGQPRVHEMQVGLQVSSEIKKKIQMRKNYYIKHFAMISADADSSPTDSDQISVLKR